MEKFRPAVFFVAPLLVPLGSIDSSPVLSIYIKCVEVDKMDQNGPNPIIFFI